MSFAESLKRIRTKFAGPREYTDAEVDAIAGCLADYPDSESPIILLRWPSDPSTVLAVPADVLEEWRRQSAEARKTPTKPAEKGRKRNGDLFRGDE